MIRLTQICLIVFLATLAIYFYQLHEGKDYSLSFLVMGAAGCLYLLLRMEQHYTQLNFKRTQAVRPANTVPRRVEPKCAVVSPVTERKPIPVLSRAHESQAKVRSLSVK
jgi:hypothetical protein